MEDYIKLWSCGILDLDFPHKKLCPLWLTYRCGLCFFIFICGTHLVLITQRVRLELRLGTYSLKASPLKCLVNTSCCSL